MRLSEYGIRLLDVQVARFTAFQEGSRRGRQVPGTAGLHSHCKAELSMFFSSSIHEDVTKSQVSALQLSQRAASQAPRFSERPGGTSGHTVVGRSVSRAKRRANHVRDSPRRQAPPRRRPPTCPLCSSLTLLSSRLPGTDQGGVAQTRGSGLASRQDGGQAVAAQPQGVRAHGGGGPG